MECVDVQLAGGAVVNLVAFVKLAQTFERTVEELGSYSLTREEEHWANQERLLAELFNDASTYTAVPLFPVGSAVAVGAMLLLTHSWLLNS